MDVNALIEKLDWNREPKGLYEPIAYTLSAGGKRLRPQLVLIGNALFGGNPQDAIPAALAIEVFHNFTLLHDDVMDKAAIRRGRPTVHIKWDENTAILSGDQMLIEAYKLLSQVPADKLPETMRLFNKMATEICEGQQYDVDFETQDNVQIADYIMMIRLKTSVLLATALEIGAYLAGASLEQRHFIYEFGVNLGIAFQIQDDWLDVYGDPATFGKAIGGDILCNKKTYIRLVAQSKVAVQNKETAAAQNGEQNTASAWPYDALEGEEKIKKVTEVYTSTGAKQICEQAIQDYTNIALENLNKVEGNETQIQQLKDLAAKLIARTK